MGALREELWKESVGEVREESFTEFIQVMVFFFILSGVEQSGQPHSCMDWANKVFLGEVFCLDGTSPVYLND